jgi:hypothetical protein
VVGNWNSKPYPQRRLKQVCTNVNALATVDVSAQPASRFSHLYVPGRLFAAEVYEFVGSRPMTRGDVMEVALPTFGRITKSEVWPLVNTTPGVERDCFSGWARA